MRILIVDDERSARSLLRSILESLPGVTLLEAEDLARARLALAQHPVDIALVDLRLGSAVTNRDGRKLVEEIRDAHPATAAIVVSVSHEMAEIRGAMRAGAYDYILKDDLCEESVLPTIQTLCARRRLESEVVRLRARLTLGAFPAGLIGHSPAMERLRATIRRVAASDRTVLVSGPTGSGKELVVRAIHALGPNPDAPLLDLNCGALPEHLIEAQLFGHERGAFTGAERRQPGVFSAARDGILFLDEIAELPMALQAKLLRVLETGRFRPVGSVSESRFAGRIVAATHADLAERVAKRSFREDLLYRLNVLSVRVPALDERREDIPALVAHFAAQQPRTLRFSSEAMAALVNGHWPGNVRQLRNLVDRLGVFAEEEEVTLRTLASVAELDRAPQSAPSLETLARMLLDQFSGQDPIGVIEQALVTEAMTRARGLKTQAAELLGVHRKVVERRLRKPGSRSEAGD